MFTFKGDSNLLTSDDQMQFLIISCNMPQTLSKTFENKKVVDVNIVDNWKKWTAAIFRLSDAT